MTVNVIDNQKRFNPDSSSRLIIKRLTIIHILGTNKDIGSYLVYVLIDLTRKDRTKARNGSSTTTPASANNPFHLNSHDDHTGRNDMEDKDESEIICLGQKSGGKGVHTL